MHKNLRVRFLLLFQLFHKAQSSEEYLNFVNKIIKYLKDQAQSTNQNSSNLNAMLGGQQANPARSTTMVGVTGGQMVHANQSQITMVRPGSAGAQMTHGTASVGQMTHTGVTDNQGVGPAGIIQGQIVTGPNRMAHMMQGNQGEMIWQTQPKARRPNDMILVMNPKTNTMGNINQLNAQPGKMGPLPITISAQNEAQVNQINVAGRLAMQPRVPSPSFAVGGAVPHPRQGTPTPTVASPVSQQQVQQAQQQQVQQAQQQQVQQAQQQQQQQQQQHVVNHSSLTFISPSPSSNTCPSPVGPAGGGRGMNQLGAPSPSGMINTPGQPQQQQPSPVVAGGSLEDRAYMEKVKQLQSKYLDTVREMVQRLDSDSENARKMRGFLEVLENPHRRATKGMETLKACEIAMERLGIQQKDSRSDGDVAAGAGGIGSVPQAKPATKENPMTVLFEAISFAQKSPLGHHTIHRTISPALKTLLGPDFGPSLPKKFKTEELLSHSTENSLISDIVQGEIARLPPRFKVNLETHQLGGSDDLTLSCQLDDPNLPCIPPITLIIPPVYPNAPPRCRLAMVEYDTTTFLKKVREIMINRQFHLPQVCSLTMILDAWEMSVRRACSTKPFVPDAINPLINLNIFS